MRYPRGEAIGVDIGKFEKIETGKGEIVRGGKSLAILAIGNMVIHSEKTAELSAANLLSADGITVEKYF